MVALLDACLATQPPPFGTALPRIMKKRPVSVFTLGLVDVVCCLLTALQTILTIDRPYHAWLQAVGPRRWASPPSICHPGPGSGPLPTAVPCELKSPKHRPQCPESTKNRTQQPVRPGFTPPSRHSQHTILLAPSSRPDAQGLINPLNAAACSSQHWRPLRPWPRGRAPTLPQVASHPRAQGAC